MDVSIGQLRLAARVIGTRDRDPTDGVVDLLTSPAAREHLFTALTTAFDGEEVLVIRTLACTAVLQADARSAPTGLAGSITAAAARLVRDHPANDDCVVRFADQAAYLAAYIHDCLDGHAHRWYYDAFEPFRRRDGSTDLAALLAAQRALRWRVLAQVRRSGDLEALLDVLGDQVFEIVGVSVDEGAAWWALVTTAAGIVREAVGALVPVDDRTTTALAHAEPPPDWRDADSLGRAVAAATAALLPTSSATQDTTFERLLAAARDRDWFDQEAFAAGLAARCGAGTPDMDEVLAPVLSPRVRHVLADLAEVVADEQLVLDPRRPTSPHNLVSLVAALAEAAPRWEDEDIARAVAAHVLRLWETGVPPGAPVSAQTPPTLTRRSPAPPTAPPLGVPGLAPAPDESSRPSPGGNTSSAAVPATTPALLARLLDERFPRPELPGDLRESSTAGGLLLLRGVFDLGLSPYLLGRVGRDEEPLLVALLRRWGGGPVGDDPVLGAVLDAAGDSPPAGSLDDACELAVARLLGLRLVAEPLSSVTVPYGAAGIASVVTDGSGHLLPSTGAGLELVPGPDDPIRRGAVADALAAVSVGHDGPDDLLLDLLAIACVQAWARWLPGFAGSSVPFLLATFVRRPAAVEVGDDEVTVLMPSRSHDVVLELAAYLDPLDAGPALGGRRMRFVTGDSHGT
jgi:hypothetical protein